MAALTPRLADILQRRRYLKRARAAALLDAVFLVEYYNAHVRREGIPGEPAAIALGEVLDPPEEADVADARVRSAKLLADAFDVGAAYFGYEGSAPYEERLARFRSDNPGFGEASYELAEAAGIHAMR